MKALTIKPPWAQAIAFPHNIPPKRVENRKWAPPASALGKDFLIHVSAHATVRELEEAMRWIDRRVMNVEPSLGGLLFPDEVNALRKACGQVIARACLVGVVRADVVVWAMHGREGYVREQLRSPWYDGPYGWVLEVREVYQLGRFVRGALGLWEVPPDVVSELEPMRS